MDAFRRENRLGDRILELLEMNVEQGSYPQSQRQLAQAVGVSAPTIGAICNGETRLPSQPLLAAIAHVLNTSEDDLLAAAGYREQSPLLSGIDPRLLQLIRQMPPKNTTKAITLLRVLEPEPAA